MASYYIRTLDNTISSKALQILILIKDNEQYIWVEIPTLHRED